MDARTSKNQKKISRKQEAKIAEDLGGRVQPASGALSGAKSDVRVMGKMRVEAKYTAKESYSLQLSELEKVIKEAGLEKAVLQVTFVDKRTNRPVLEIAIAPYETKSVAFVFPDNADLQTFSKRVTLQRDRVAVKLLKQGSLFVVFSNRELNGNTKHNWFQVISWTTYLAMVEEINRNA